MRSVLGFTLLFTLLPLSVSAQCPSDLPLDRLLKGTVIEMTSPLDCGAPISRGAPKATWRDGKCQPGEHPKDFSRTITIGFRVLPTGVKKVQPFRCELSRKKMQSSKSGTTELNLLDFDWENGCPIMDIHFTRAEVDLRKSKPMTLASLRHNLGPNWKITPVCDQSSPQTAKESALKEKKLPHQRAGELIESTPRSRDSKTTVQGQ
jgi:hypothetical protein